MKAASCVWNQTVLVLAMALIALSLVGAVQAVFLPTTGGITCGIGMWGGYVDWHSCNSACIDVAIGLDRDPNNENKPWRFQHYVTRQRRVREDIPILPWARVICDAGGAYVRVQIPYPVTLLFGLLLTWRQWRSIRSKRVGFPVVSRRPNNGLAPDDSGLP
jgi:hypothetical protein